MQAVSCLALFALQCRIDGSTQRNTEHLRLASWWRRTLVLASASICVLWYLGSGLVMLAAWGVDAAAPAAGITFVLCALAQMCVGLSFHKINRALKTHFSGGECTELETRGTGSGTLPPSSLMASKKKSGHTGAEPPSAGYLPPADTTDVDECDAHTSLADGRRGEKHGNAQGGAGMAAVCTGGGQAVSPRVVALRLSS